WIKITLLKVFINQNKYEKQIPVENLRCGRRAGNVVGASREQFRSGRESRHAIHQGRGGRFDVLPGPRGQRRQAQGCSREMHQGRRISGSADRKRSTLSRDWGSQTDERGTGPQGR